MGEWTDDMSTESDPVEALRELSTLEELSRVAREIIAQEGDNPIATTLLVDRAEQLTEHLKGRA